MEPEVCLKFRKVRKYIYPMPQKYMWLVTNIGKNDLMKLYKSILKMYRLNRKGYGVDPASIINRVIIFLFIKSLYNKDIRRRVADAKVI